MLKVIFAGSPDVASKTLDVLFQNQSAFGFKITGVISNPPSAKGRHKELIPTPVASYAIQNQIPVFTPEHLDSVAREQISPLNADLLISFAYGHIFGPKFLALFPMGGINLHPSLLPKYRGCTPVPAAILNRDSQTAVTIQKLVLKMDEGDILEQQKIDLNGTETGGSLLEKTALIGAELILKVLKSTINDGKLPKGVSQTGNSSYTNIITKDNARINWNDDVEKIEAMVRAYYPEPGCWTLENGLQLKILHASFIPFTEDKVSSYKDKQNGTVVDFCKSEGIYIKANNGILCVQTLQRQGKKDMNYKDFMNGAHNFVGTILE